MKLLKVLSLFSGIGSFEKALTLLGIDYELVNYCENDKYASKSYAAIHGVSEELNLGDITTVDTFELSNDIDFVCHGSPCQDFSIAGKQAGGDKDSGTRSSLMYETLRIVEATRPKIVLWENVKNVLSKKHIHNFDAYRARLKDFGYNSYYKVLNAKDFGIPQNRERIFVISIREDVDKGNFKFPEPFELKLRLRDMLEETVDEKYYLSQKVQERFKVTDPTFTKNIIGTTKPEFRTIGQRDLVYQEDSIMGALVATDYKQPKQVAIRLGGVFDTEKSKHQAGSVWDVDGLAPTLDTMQGGYRQPCIIDSPSIVKVDVPQIVRVRKYEVDCNKLVGVLREHKSLVGLTNKSIADQLNIPLTKVEHWFRTDDCFAIPDENIWFDLKKLLQIKTDEFDESIMTFEEREGVYEKTNRCYYDGGIAPTLTCANDGEKIIESRLKEKFKEKDVIVGSTQKNAAISKDGICPTLTSAMGMGGGHVPMHNYDLRIRKLTPKECWRLMGFEDSDIDNCITIGISDTQLYKQAGNSIVVNVLVEIYKELFKAVNLE